MFFINTPRLLVETRLGMAELMRRCLHRVRRKVILGTCCEALIITVKRGVGTTYWMWHHWVDGRKVVIWIVYRGPACDWNSILNHHGM